LFKYATNENGLVRQREIMWINLSMAFGTESWIEAIVDEDFKYRR
jgi:lauroyl/myristoyl acyltransferase